MAKSKSVEKSPISISTVDAIEWICSRVERENLPLDRQCKETIASRLLTFSNCLSIEIEESWSVGATLSIELRRDISKSSDYEIYIPKILMNWSSTHRTLAQSQACIVLFQKLTNLGCAIQAKFDGQTIGEEA